MMDWTQEYFAACLNCAVDLDQKSSVSRVACLPLLSHLLVVGFFTDTVCPAIMSGLVVLCLDVELRLLSDTLCLADSAADKSVLDLRAAAVIGASVFILLP
jgi:hypothetical protein